MDNTTSHPCPVLNLPQDENSVKERKEHLATVWDGVDLPFEEIESKYAWWDAVHTVIENKNGIKPASTSK